MTEIATTEEPSTNDSATSPPEPTVKAVKIAGNSTRIELILTAAADNQGVVWLGGQENNGTPLKPDEKITLKITEPILVIGVAGDWLHVAELTERVK